MDNSMPLGIRVKDDANDKKFIRFEWDVGEEYANLMRMAEWYEDENNPSIRFVDW